MRNFTPEDFSGSGQYLLRMSPEELHAKEEGKPFSGYRDAGYLSTIVYKVGYLINNFNIGNGEQIVALVSMADGNISICHYPNYKKVNEAMRKGDPIPEGIDQFEKVVWQHDSFEEKNGKQIFCNYLNTKSQEMRFATQEEIVRVVLYQKSRWR